MCQVAVVQALHCTCSTEEKDSRGIQGGDDIIIDNFLSSKICSKQVRQCGHQG